jgi:hypothetical protein
MMSEFELQKLANLIRDGDAETALRQVTSDTQAAIENADIWATRAFVEDLLEMFDAAEASISNALRLDPSIGNLFKRASIRLKAGHATDALTDALAVVATGEAFYHNEALLLAAEAKRRLGRWGDAMKDCESLPENAEVWSGGLIAAREIRAQCSRMLAQRKAA